MDIILHSDGGTLLPITLAFSIVGIFIIAWGIILGLFRGVHRSAIRLCTVAVSAVLAFIIAKPSAASTEILYSTANYFGLDVMKFPLSLRNLVVGYTSAVAAPFVFFGAFIILNVVFYLIYLIVAFCAFPRRKYKPKDGSKGLKRHRLVGALVSALAGALMVACFNLPFYGYSDFVANKLDKTLEPFRAEVEFIDTNGVNDVISKFTLGDKLFNSLTTAKINGTKICVTEDMGEIADAAVNVVSFASKPMKDWEAGDRAALERAIEVAKTSDTVSDLVCSGAEFAVIVINSPVEFEELDIPEIPMEFRDTVIDLLEKLSDKESGAFNEVIDAFSAVVLSIADSMKRNGSDTLTGEQILEDEVLLAELLDSVLSAPVLDGVTVAVVDKGLEMMASEMSVQGEFKVDAEAWSASTDAERDAEAKLLAEVIPELLSVSEGEDGDSKTEFNAAGTIVKLKDSRLVGPLANKVLVTVAGSYLTDLIGGGQTGADTGDIEDVVGDVIEGGEINSGMMDALPEIVENAELSDEDVNALKEVVNELEFDKETADQLPDYLKDFLDKHGIEIKVKD